MKRFTNALTIMITGCLGILLITCSYNTPQVPSFNVTQEQLNHATIISSIQDTAIVGDPFNGFASDAFTTDHKLRDLFENISLNQSIKVGTIMTRRSYYYPWTQFKRDSLLNVVVMIKREAGYYPQGGDWEYMDIKYNKNTNYIENPNGMLIGSIDNITRGKITKCANCHANSGTDFIFHRDN
jgi:hypothetical protein